MELLSIRLALLLLVSTATAVSKISPAYTCSTGPVQSKHSLKHCQLAFASLYSTIPEETTSWSSSNHTASQRGSCEVVVSSSKELLLSKSAIQEAFYQVARNCPYGSYKLDNTSVLAVIQRSSIKDSPMHNSQNGISIRKRTDNDCRQIAQFAHQGSIVWTLVEVFRQTTLSLPLFPIAAAEALHDALTDTMFAQQGPTGTALAQADHFTPIETSLFGVIAQMALGPGLSFGTLLRDPTFVEQRLDLPVVFAGMLEATNDFINHGGREMAIYHLADIAGRIIFKITLHAARVGSI